MRVESLEMAYPYIEHGRIGLGTRSNIHHKARGIFDGRQIWIEFTLLKQLLIFLLEQRIVVCGLEGSLGGAVQVGYLPYEVEVIFIVYILLEKEHPVLFPDVVHDWLGDDHLRFRFLK